MIWIFGHCIFLGIMTYHMNQADRFPVLYALCAGMVIQMELDRRFNKAKKSQP